MFAPLPEGGQRKFPTQAVVILALCMSVNSYTIVSLFPYVGVMVMELLRLPTTNESGFYAGYVASAFTFGRFVSGYFWGYVSDAVGRKPVIVFGLTAMSVFSLAFGLSASYSFAVSSRFLLGLMSGIMPALRSTVHEICGPEHVAQGMAYADSSKAVGLVVGTGIGGLLAQPALHYPSVFSASGLFGKYPFFLPNLVGALCGFVMVSVVMIWLPETRHLVHTTEMDSGGRDDIGATTIPSPGQTPLKSSCSTADSRSRSSSSRVPSVHRWPNDGTKKHAPPEQIGASNGHAENGTGDRVDSPHRRNGCASGDEHATGTNSEHEPGLCGEDGLCVTPHVKSILCLICTTQALLIGFDETFPLWAISTPDAGGLGWSIPQIGKLFLAAGLVMALCQVVVFPLLIQRLGIVVWQRVGCLFGILAFFATPSAKSIGLNDTSLFIASVASNTLVNCSLTAVNVALAIASTSVVPSKMRGKMSGLFNTAESLGRFTGSAGFAVMFAWSISPSAYDWVDFHFVFYASGVVLSVVAVLAWLILTRDVFEGAEGANSVNSSTAHHANTGVLSEAHHSNGERDMV